MTSYEYNAYIETVEQASQVPLRIRGGEPDYLGLVDEELTIVHASDELRSTTLRLFERFYDNFPSWGKEVAVGLPVGMSVLAIIAKEHKEADKSQYELPEPATVIASDALSDIGKQEIARRRPEVIEASLTGIGWGEDTYQAIKPHPILGYYMARAADAPRGVCLGVGTHHIYQTPSYGVREHLTPAESMVARLTANTDYALALASRNDSRTPQGGEPAIRQGIINETLKKFAGTETPEVLDKIAAETADKSIAAGKLLGSTCLVAA